MFGWQYFKPFPVDPPVDLGTSARDPVPPPVSIVRDTSETRRGARTDLLVGIGAANETNLALRKILRDSFGLVDEMAAFSSAFEATASAMQTRADGFVASVSSLQTQSELIEDRLSKAADDLTEAHAFARAASSGVVELKCSIDDVERVIKMIASIAAQTNLLALNATIEAARAGPAGAGFRVVAEEVKSLSQQTHRATQEIVASFKRIRERADVNGTLADDVDRAIATIEEVFGEVRASVSQQGEQTRRIGLGSEEIATLAQDIRGSAGRMHVLGDTARAMMERAERAAAAARGAFTTLEERAAIVLRHGDGDEANGVRRWPTMLAATLMANGQRHPARVIDLAADAMQIETGADLAISLLGETVAVEVEDLGRFDVRLLTPTLSGYETVLVEPSPAVVDRVEMKLAELGLVYRPYIDRVQRMAAEAAAIIEDRIEQGLLSAADLFDSHYRRDGDNEPAQYVNAAVAPLEAFVRPLLEGALLESPEPDFCILQDRNGFNPVHNVHYSRPARRGDIVWNLRNSRNRRIFDDRVGMSASRNLKAFLVQSYARDLGDAIETRMEFDGPIFIQGRHWGALRMAYRLENTREVSSTDRADTRP